jgi:hypothetical protein
MTVRAFVQSSSGRDLIEIDSIEGKNAKKRPEATGARHAENEDGERTMTARCSPDPAQHTDRYRLVTPFSLRL